MDEKEFFSEYGEAARYRLQEVIGRGSYGIVCSAIDTHTGEKVAIKKINDIFEHVSDATRILREIKLLRLLRHPDIVEIKHIMLPPARRGFKDIYVVFELMESDLHQVIKANDDLTPEHYQFFLYQLLRALKYIHTANVFHRDLKPKNVLANADCKLKICDFGLARVAFSDAPTAIFWTDYVATRWYRAPELCGSFFSKYTPAIDIWSIGCIFAELLTGKPLFPGKNVVHQLELMTDLLGTPSQESIAKVRNEKARRYLSSMRRKPAVPLQQKFPNADPAAVKLLGRLLSFDPAHRPSAEEALADPYFKGLAKVEREPSAQPITKVEFEFERRRLNMDDVRELIYREILEYHPHVLKDYLMGTDSGSYLFPSAVDQFRRQFNQLEDHYSKGNAPGSVPPPQIERQAASLPKERIQKEVAPNRAEYEEMRRKAAAQQSGHGHHHHHHQQQHQQQPQQHQHQQQQPQQGHHMQGHQQNGATSTAGRRTPSGHNQPSYAARPSGSGVQGYGPVPTGYTRGSARPGRVVGAASFNSMQSRPGSAGHSLIEEGRRYQRTAALSQQSPFHGIGIGKDGEGDKPVPAAAEAR